MKWPSQTLAIDHIDALIDVVARPVVGRYPTIYVVYVGWARTILTPSALLPHLGTDLC